MSPFLVIDVAQLGVILTGFAALSASIVALVRARKIVPKERESMEAEITDKLVGTARDLVRDVESGIERLRGDLRDVQGRLDSAITELQRVTTELQETRSELRRVTQERDELKVENDSLKDRVQHLEDRLADLESGAS